MNALSTKSDSATQVWPIQDDVVQLREWGTDRVFGVPPTTGSYLIGTDEECQIRIEDRTHCTSRKHAMIRREYLGWTIEDTGSRNGLWLNGARYDSFIVEPGDEIGVGEVTLIAESTRLIAVRRYLARILGWSSDRKVSVDLALRSIRRAASGRAALVLTGDTEVIAVARSLHYRVLGSDRPFIVCRRAPRSSFGTAKYREHGMAALHNARGGSLCVMGWALPHDFAQVLSALREPERQVQLVVCLTKGGDQADGPLAMAIEVPPLRCRTDELSRIVDEYANDAISRLGAGAPFPEHDHAWVMDHAVTSLGEIETATLRLVALRMGNSVNSAATRLGMSHAALSRWMKRRQLLLKLG